MKAGHETDRPPTLSGATRQKSNMKALATQQPDSLAAAAHEEAEQPAAAVRTHREPTPDEVLRALPADATPEQQDSAVQASMKPRQITYSSRPDTLHLPGWPAGRSYRDVTLPQYYRESYFEGKPCFHPELFGGRLGVAGDPVPYSIARDNVITALLIGCFVLALVAYAKSRRFILRQAKDFFRPPYGEKMTAMTETAGEIRFQFFLVMQTCLLLALVYFFHVQIKVTDTFVIDQYQVIGIYAAIIFAGILVKGGAYSLAGWVFFDKRRNEMWMKALLFLLAMEGVALFPVVMLQAYFEMPVQATLVCTAIVLGVFRLLAFYKQYIIFFRREGLSLQIFLYFCTLEIIPMAALLGALAIVSSYLKVNY